MEIEALQTVELPLIKRLVHMETEAFGSGGLNEWHLTPLIRHGRVFIAQEQQEVIGMIQYMRDWDNPQKVYLVGVSIDKKARGRGLGTQFIQSSLETLKKENIKAAELTVNPENAAAIRVYTKLGFVTKDLRRDEYGAGEHRLVMLLSFADL